MIELPKRRKVHRDQRWEETAIGEPGPKEETIAYVYEWGPGEGPIVTSKYDRHNRRRRLTKLVVRPHSSYGIVSATGRLVRKDGTPGVDASTVYLTDTDVSTVLYEHQRWGLS